MKIKPSERLYYRLLGTHIDDANLLFELDQDPEVMRFISGGVITPLESIHSVFIPRLASYTDPNKGWGMWGVFSHSSDDFVGWILVRPMHFFSQHRDDSDIELGWRFKRAFWGQGIATEAARHIITALHIQQGINTFSAIAVKENHASINIMLKLGMSFKSSGVHKDPLGDMLVDTYQLSLNGAK